MKQFYQECGIDIYCEDMHSMIGLLPSVDLIVTDPPYELSNSLPGDEHYGCNLQKFESDSYRKLTTGIDVDFVFGEFKKLMDKFNMFCFCSNKQISKMMSWGESMGFSTTLLVWHKTNAVPFAKGVWRGDIEYCVHIRESGACFDGNAQMKKKVSSFPFVNNAHHPTEKPLQLIQKYVSIGSRKGDLILDPYMGSGTTLLAAKNLGRRAIGIDIEEKYCEMAVKRLAPGVLPI